VPELINELPERDIDFLSEKGYEYQLVPYSSGIYLIISQFPLSKAYNPSIADLLIMIPTGYPNTPLDMFWTNPDVRLISGSWPTASEHHELHAERNWQRWSRHTNWRTGVDNLRTFMSSVRKEIEKGI
jgi:hypothetical protein